MAYFDTSVIVAYYVPEALSRQAQQRLSTARIVTVSDLTQIELVSALSLRYRIGDLSYADAHRISGIFAGHLDRSRYRKFHFDAEIYRLAYGYIARFDLPLKAPDALHLAATWHTRTTLITADRQLANNAEALDIAVDLLMATST